MLSHHKRSEAMQQFAAPLKKSINCFVDGSLRVRVPEVGGISSINLNDATEPTSLRLRDGFSHSLGINITLSVRMCDKDGEPFVETLGYSHMLQVDGKERIRYDWHPQVGVTFSHIHLVKGEEHIPTGRVLVEDLLIAALEFGAKPNDGWKQCLTSSYEAFLKTASWGQPEKSRLETWLDRWDDEGNPVLSSN